ncbi:MAG: hypothetical protein JWM95_3374 [Gemmatimonadetes bacterium]|nr:hypothetical protein [Gemmatimonadota bacterium]
MASVSRRAFAAIVRSLRVTLERLETFDADRTARLATREQAAFAPPLRVLVTGAAGGVATLVRPYLRTMFPLLVLTDQHPVTDLAAGEQFVRADLRDRHALDALMAQVDAVLHLGAASVEASFDDLLGPNIIGVVNVLEAARAADVKRVVIASTMHVLGMYRRHERVDPSSLTKPDSRYAVTKVFAEQLASLYSAKWSMRTACIRIGHVTPEQGTADPANWISPDDLGRLFEMALKHPDIRQEVFHAVADYTSDDRGQEATAQAFGFRARQAGGSYADALLHVEQHFKDDATGRLYRGGWFASSGWEPV